MSWAAMGFTVASAQPSAPATILVVGDSISAEYGIARGSGWVALLQSRLAQQKSPAYQVVNASISGDTSSGGRARLAGLLKQHQPKIVVIELGANDALRGLPLASTQANLAAMVDSAQQSGAKVLLLGMQVPPNYGARYTADFAKVFTTLAADKKTGLVPFLLQGVADVPDAGKNFQADRIHPLASAHPTLLANVWPQLQKLM
ncbi:acyl-CoA thioesterase-1 [Comamonas odontotermitis]|uniref:Acyl-CoA thioesterase-1 n=1 Tax=Comamonas odontotermitis TaxID=379895 RepID=A0ABR6RFP0_9BURK|nr:arylesterase [Comamonas odontotermitis]MBB6577949.1 acyl-CoA thioesterase-1 [Comamonas odontotermitis]